MDKDFLTELELPFNTPDLCMLENHRWHLVFDCGKPKMNKHLVCPAYTLERMSLFIDRERDQPIPVRLYKQPRARIGGGLFAVPTKEIIALDKVHQNRLKYERRKTPIYIPVKDENGNPTLFTEAWSYQAIPEVWEERIEMNMPKYNVHRRNPDIVLAQTYTDNESVFNNHFRYSPFQVADFQPKRPLVQATQAVKDYVRRKNDETAKQLDELKMLLVNNTNIFGSRE